MCPRRRTWGRAQRVVAGGRGAERPREENGSWTDQRCALRTWLRLAQSASGTYQSSGKHTSTTNTKQEDGRDEPLLALVSSPKRWSPTAAGTDLLSGERLGGEVVDAVVEAPLNETRVQLHKVLHLQTGEARPGGEAEGEGRVSSSATDQRPCRTLHPPELDQQRGQRLTCFFSMILDLRE